MNDLTEKIFNALTSLDEKIQGYTYEIELGAKERICDVFEKIIIASPTELELYQYCLIITEKESKQEKNQRLKRELKSDYIKDEITKYINKGLIDNYNQFLIDIKDLNLKETTIDACKTFYELVPKSTEAYDQMSDSEFFNNLFDKIDSSPKIKDFIKNRHFNEGFFELIKEYLSPQITELNLNLIKASFNKELLRIDVNTPFDEEQKQEITNYIRNNKLLDKTCPCCGKKMHVVVYKTPFGKADMMFIT